MTPVIRPTFEIRSLVGVYAREWLRYRRLLHARGDAYLAICNRHERLEAGPDDIGRRCMWRWTSELNAPKHVPRLGAALMRRALEDHPVRRATTTPKGKDAPQVSFVIGHRGLGRLPHLLATLESIAGQEGTQIECIVVEQDDQAQLVSHLPAWIRHVHTPLPRPDLPFCRSWAFNVGVRHARGAALILHDGDMLVPHDYALHALRLLDKGFEVLNLKRFVFYLSKEHSGRIFDAQAGLTDSPPMSIIQNLEGGGSVAITRAGYEAIGGFDEAFVGWGGEDVEFWERASSLRVWPYAFLPLVHVWHESQPEKEVHQSDTLRLYYELTQIPVAERIAKLRAAHRGRSYKAEADDAAV